MARSVITGKMEQRGVKTIEEVCGAALLPGILAKDMPERVRLLREFLASVVFVENRYKDHQEPCCLVISQRLGSG